MPGAPDPEYVLARRVLLDALQALGEHRSAVVLVGAQAIAPYTTDGDVAIDPSRLRDDPRLAEALSGAGLSADTRHVGTWITNRSLEGRVVEVKIDLMVPEVVGGPGRRGARLGLHGNRAARKARGLEATFVDREQRSIEALEEDVRAFEVAVAGPAALLVAKLPPSAATTHLSGRQPPRLPALVGTERGRPCAQEVASRRTDGHRAARARRTGLPWWPRSPRRRPTGRVPLWVAHFGSVAFLVIRENRGSNTPLAVVVLRRLPVAGVPSSSKISSWTQGRRTMRDPVFNGTMQLGIVVRDLEATVRRYEDDYGIGPWDFARIDLGEANDYREYGRLAERSNRIAVCTVGRVMWELIEPLDEEGIWARFLAEKGEGIHHVAVATPNFDETVARAEHENKVFLSGKFGGIDIAYLDTQRDLGVVLEVFSGFPAADQQPDAT